MWRGHAHLRDILSSVGWDLLCSTHIKFEVSTITCNEEKIFVLSHPLGDRGNVHGSSMARWKARGRLPVGAN